MNTYITNEIARDHVARLMTDAEAARRVRLARRARPASLVAARVPAAARSASGGRAAGSAGYLLTHPVAAFHHWITAGEL
jgi:hypothetical protein